MLSKALRDRVGEDVGAAHHRHPEDDRERGQDRAAAAEEQALERDPAHLGASSCVAATIVRDVGVGQIRDDLPVGEEEDAVGDRRRGGVVGDHQRGLAVGVDR